MKRGWQAIALTAVLAAVASGAGTWISASWVLSRREPPSLHDIVHHDLKLSPDQLTRIDAVEARFAARRPALEADVRAANQELARAIARSDGDGPQVQAAVDHFHVAMDALQKETIAHVFEMRSVLTPAQAEVFDDRIVEALAPDEG
ncbi:Spy/CpxP family protein refolding chaperone [Brevundimonas sp.]|jgi:Spy/CpxP family protein refolding chaperone|uniref:Spy/CpxP family protein refolding chaperone n=1 Tax=Brevundimonas sp. TaxID=1871086 RepID=UPI000E94DB01|nr:periplasmic heavy metal sensor [Brevundimonas sp.]HBI17774.1 heavy metal resistance protein [Brevundimonas sp.]